MRILIAGDFSPTEQVLPYFEQRDLRTLFGDIPDAFRGADRVVVNLECALTAHGVPIRKIGPNLKAPPICAAVLRDLGVTDCALSNNHVLDYGVQGLRDTLRHLEANGLRWTGVGEDDVQSRRPHRLTDQGPRVTLIAVCEHEYSFALPNQMGANPYDPYDTMEDIRKAKAESDRVIVLYHGGKEHCAYPSPRLRKLCQAMARNGADVVLCQHSHCIGCYERYEGAHILYGQGNFHFVKGSPHPGWSSGLIVQLDVGESVGISFLPIRMHEAGIDWARDAERDAILDAFQARNEALTTRAWEGEWARFCESVRPQYDRVVAQALQPDADEQQNEIFASYLLCQAHYDVLLELNKTWHTRSVRDSFSIP